MRLFYRRLALFVPCVALAALSLAPAAFAADEFDQFAVESVSASLSTTQAGAHADFTTGIKLTQKEGLPYAFTRDIEVHLPPGISGNPQNFQRCTVDQLGNAPDQSACPIDSQVGVSEVRVSEPNGSFLEPVYNMPSPGGDVVARLGFFAAIYPTFINVRIDPVDLSLVATVEGAASAAGLQSAITTLWGVPAADEHDNQRLTPLEALNGEAVGREAEAAPKPFMSNPTDCTLTRQVTVTARSYQLPNDPSTKSAPFPQITGCSLIDFAVGFTITPTNPEAAAPTGIDAVLTIPQNESPQGKATSTLKSAVVTLPEGFVVNSAAANGLEACSASQVGFEKNEAAHCPDGAKIGSVEMDVPALEQPLHGSVYQRTPEPGHLFRFWVVADEQGVHLKLPAEIETDPVTGQLTTIFAGIPALGGNPQVPFRELQLHVFGGPRAPLSTPASCGTYATRYSYSPWSGRDPVEGEAPMSITSGCGKGGFDPGLSAGMRSLRAGAFSPFVFTLTRQDGEASPQTIALHMPQGLLAKLSGVELCPESAAAGGACPAASRVGSLVAAAGVGGSPLWIPQPGKAPTAAYLAGPYKGAPYSIVSVVPAQAGPFDLGLVVNRAGIYVDPETALATIVTDPLPQILEGVPVSYRTLHVEVDRENFTLNPTSCATKKVSATVTATNGQVAEPSVPFQSTNCAKLAYSPQLRLAFKGSIKRTGNPGVEAVLTQKPNQANTKAATVLLPKSQFIDNAHISNPCTRVQFAAEACPKGSVLGKVKAWTPLLDKPLQGKVYFRSNGGERELPDLVADLRGQIRIILVGWIDSVNGRVRTRFRSVPDAPVSRFVMNLFAGKRGLIENSKPLCKTSRRAKVNLQAQNGLSVVTDNPIQVKCGKTSGK